MNAGGDGTDTAFESAACGLLTTTPAGTITRVNATTCGWVGMSADALVGRRFQDLLTVGSKLFHQTHWMPLLQMQGSVAEVQLEVVHRDGRVVPVLVNAARRSDADVVDIAIFVTADRRKYERELLLARRRAEELLESERRAQEALRLREAEFRALAENSPDLIVRFDAARRYAYLNPAIERLTGRPSSHYLGKTLAEAALPHETAGPWAAALDEAFAGRGSTIDFAFASAVGRRELQANIVPERDDRGETSSVLAITRDVTLLRQQEREAEQRAMLSEQLIGIVSHDLRNPLNAVLLGAHLLASADLGENGRVVARIAGAAERANRLIADLLDFTQARLGGGLRVEHAELNLHALAAEALDEIRLAHPGRAIEHRREGDGAGTGDADRLVQVLTNLVTNALTYGAEAEAVVVTTIGRSDQLELRVHNGGEPIPHDVQARIFEPLQRGTQQVRRGSRSVGLGLYIVKQIATAHGGAVAVRSMPESGTTFVVTLPRGRERGPHLAAVPLDAP